MYTDTNVYALYSLHAAGHSYAKCATFITRNMSYIAFDVLRTPGRITQTDEPSNSL